MKTVWKIVGGLVGLVVVAAGGAFLFGKSKLAEKLERTPGTHQVDFPVPFPLTEGELERLRQERAAKQAEATDDSEAQAADREAAPTEGDDPAAAADGEDEGEGATDDGAKAEAEPAPDPLEGVDLEALALQRAIRRGRHLVEARYACIECHGQNFGGGVMVDDPALGAFLGPNLTAGKGSKTEGYSVADWDRIVRHGVKRDGHPGIMPAEDFQRMTDRELSDIIAYVRSVPAVDNEVPTVTYGPVGTMLVGFGAIPMAVDLIEDHLVDHERWPPPSKPDEAFGEHLAGVCTGCHRKTLQGGPILAGDPDWPPALNLTPHEEGLAGWTFEQFETALREGKRPDGTALRKPMSQMTPYCARMTDTEMRALWAYIQSVEPLPTAK